MKIIETADGSSTIYVEQFDQTYHSIHGAVQESKHIYIDAGFGYCKKQTIKILEIGFGTGLNALLTCLKSKESNKISLYTAIELYPLKPEIYNNLNFLESTEFSIDIFHKIHNSKWNIEEKITDNFFITKISNDLLKLELTDKFDIIYFDAFSPEKQPELWTKSVFENLFFCLENGGILVTYCVKGIVKEALRAAGFTVKRLPGPPGKHQILRASKPI